MRKWRNYTSITKCVAHCHYSCTSSVYRCQRLKRARVCYVRLRLTLWIHVASGAPRNLTSREHGCASHSGYKLQDVRRGSSPRGEDDQVPEPSLLDELVSGVPVEPELHSQIFMRNVSDRMLSHWIFALCHRSLDDGVTRATDVIVVGKHASVCGYGEDCTSSLCGSGAPVLCHLQACLKVSGSRPPCLKTDIFASSTCHVKMVNNSAFVGNTRHFDNEIDFAGSVG